VQHFYRCDARDPAHYHLVIDSTAIPLDDCVELIVVAALARGRGE
jgi:cytidylate kinase